MPVWHEKTKEWVKDGRQAVVGVAQEQHPDRCRLMAKPLVAAGALIAAAALVARAVTKGRET